MSQVDINSEVIGEGTYGCVHKPPMKCMNKKRSKMASISKLMTDNNAKTEMREFKLISSADKENKLYLGKPSKCKADKDLSNIQAVNKCSGRFNASKIDEYSLLLMKYGGQDLEKFGNEVYSWKKTKQNVDNIELFWLECVRLFYGLKVFEENGIVHHDLKQQNIVYDQKTNRINFIDFGFMTKKSSIISMAKISRYWLGDSNHWSFPLENIYWNKQNYLDAIKSVNKDTTDSYTEFAEGVVSKCGYFFTSILPVKSDKTDYEKLTKRATTTSFENVIEFDKEEYDRFINKSIDTVDSYGVGIALMYVLNRSKHLLPDRFASDLRTLFVNYMLNPHVFIRFNPDQLLANYENILLNSGFLEKHDLHIENHFIENKLSKEASLLNKIKSSGYLLKPPGFTPTPSQIEIVRECPDGKEFNPLTKRCVKICKPRYVRNPDFKCVLVKKTKTKRIEQVTKRSKSTKRSQSMKRSKSMKRSQSMKQKKTQNITHKKCPEGKQFNPNTNRCVKDCKPGYIRDEKFKCKKMGNPFDT